jgi:hypothetical protein
MAALAERYPGAPAHWLAHVAERTSRLAETGEVPLSLNSDPAAWTPTRPDVLPPPVEANPSPDPAPARPSARQANPREAVAPTLAALRERSSETWRRPDTAPKRRPRPVFASPLPVSDVGSSTPAVSIPGRDDPARRPRSPLSVKTHSSSPERPPARAVSDPIAQPGATVRGATWSDMSRPDVGRSEPPSIHGPSEGPGPDLRAGVEPRTAREPELHPDTRPPASTAGDRKPWFFEAFVRAPVRVARSLALGSERARRAASAGGAWAVAETSSVVERAPITLATGPSEDAHPAPAERRAISRVFEALRARPRSEDRRVARPIVAKTAPSTAWPAESAFARAAKSGVEPSGTAFRMRAPSIVSRLDHDHLSLAAAIHPTEPPPRARGHGASTLGRTAFTQDGDVHDRARRSTFAAIDQPLSRDTARRFAGSPPDNRWPALPPVIFSPPEAVEASAPRWDELAREQEEGRWSV